MAGYGVENLPWCLREKQNGALVYLDFLKLIKAMIILSVKGYTEKNTFFYLQAAYVFSSGQPFLPIFSICWDPTPLLSLPVATLSMKCLKPTPAAQNPLSVFWLGLFLTSITTTDCRALFYFFPFICLCFSARLYPGARNSFVFESLVAFTTEPCTL